ncbi:MAG: 50S ribosomal protein L20 [Proteobacteria bacterium]|nr:50S ribosomal protein L20 [Pseudomonadota bacterium]
MSRVTRGFKARRKRNKILKLSKGFRGARSRNFRSAITVVHRSLQFAYRDRRVRKREFRKLWITRINAASRLYGLKYSEFIHGLSLANVTMDRSILAELASSDNQKPFEAVVAVSKKALNKA